MAAEEFIDSFYSVSAAEVCTLMKTRWMPI